MMKFVFCMQINIKIFCKVILSFWVSVTRHAQSTQNKFVYLFNISIKAWMMKLIFDLQKMTASLGVRRQTGPNYQKQPSNNLFALSQGKHQGWSWFFACWLMLKVFSNFQKGFFYHFRCVWPGMPKLPKITSFIFLYNILRKKWVAQLIFYMQISMKACQKLILRFFDGYAQAFPK